MPCGSEWNDCICISKSTNSWEPSAVQEDSQVQPDDPLRGLQLSNSWSTVIGIPSEAVARSLPDDISNTMSVSPLDSAGSEIVPSKKLHCEIPREADIDRSAIPAGELDIIFPDDTDASVEQPGTGCLDKVDFVSQASSPTPLRSSDSERCERRTQGDYAVPANPVCLEPNTEHMLVTAMSARRNELILAGALPVIQSHIRCNGDSVKSRTYRDGSGRKRHHFKSTLQTSWTKDLDEHLLHLRQIA